MANVKCNVCECEHNDKNACCCTLGSIEITHEKTSANSIENPHYCKSYCKCGGCGCSCNG